MEEYELNEIDFRSDSEDEEVEYEQIDSSSHLLLRPSKTLLGSRKNSPWNSGCMVRLIMLFCMLMIAIGFGINNMPPIIVSSVNFNNIFISLNHKVQ